MALGFSVRSPLSGTDPKRSFPWQEWYTSDATHHPQSNVDQPSSSLLSAGATAAAAAAASSGAGGQATLDRAALQKQKVAVPAAGSAEAELGLGDKPCPICQDRFKSEWSDDEEEWVWWNAVVVDKVVSRGTISGRAIVSVGGQSDQVLSLLTTALSRDVPRRGSPFALERGSVRVTNVGADFARINAGDHRLAEAQSRQCRPLGSSSSSAQSSDLAYESQA